jgi:hypothetical protein
VELNGMYNSSITKRILSMFDRNLMPLGSINLRWLCASRTHDCTPIYCTPEWMETTATALRARFQ